MKSVFISSTFKDMQAERDYLHEKIFPKLRKEISRYGEDIQELDLRWGVDTYNMTEEESGYQVLRICVDAIDRCKPYIIVLLGDRYGWIPDAGIVDSLKDDRISFQYEENMSITNLEIKYGVLSEKETLERCVFCFRNSDFLNQIPEEKRMDYVAESDYHAQKIHELKQQIRSKENAYIIDYQVQWDEEKERSCNLEAFGESVTEIILKILEKDFEGKKVKNHVEQMILDAEYTKERYLSTYIPRLQEEKDGAEALLQMTKKTMNCLHYLGDAGCGKSALLSAMEDSLKKIGANTILYYSGNPGCQSVFSLKEVLIYRLEEILEKEHKTEIPDRSEYLRELGMLIKEKTVFLFIDALDQLFDKTEEKYLDVLEMCPGLCFITSSLKDFSYEQTLVFAEGIKVVEVGELKESDKLQLIQRTCLYRGKSLDDQIKAHICEKKGSSNPLFLSLLLQRLFAMRQEDFQTAETMGNGMDGLHRYMEQIIEETPQDICEVATSLFYKVGHMFQSEFFETVANLIAFSRNGLTESEIREIMAMQGLGFSSIQFQEILFYLYDVFTENENGKWMFTHRIFYEALQENSKNERNLYINYFIEYSRINPDFMELEGYFHILSEKHILGINVLEKCKEWKSYNHICQMAAKMLETKDGQNYFLQLLNETKNHCVIDFIKRISRFDRNDKVEKFRKEVYLRAIGKDYILPEYKTELLMDVLKIDKGSEWTALFEKIKSLLTEYSDEKRRIFDTYKLQYEEIIYLIYELGQKEEGFQRLNVHLEEIKAWFYDKDIGKEVLYRYVFETYIYASGMRRVLKKDASKRLTDALELYDKFSDVMLDRKFQLTKVELCMELSRHTKSKEYAEIALELAREWEDKESSVEVLDLLGNALNLYGMRVEPENRYLYRYESYIVAKRTYQVAKTNYWKQVLADQAGYFAKEVNNHFPEPWRTRREEAWELCFKYNEELYREGYTDVSDTSYEKYILNYTEQNVKIDYLKKAYEIISDRKKRGWDSQDIYDWNDCWRICAALIEQLEDEKYLSEMLTYSRKIYQVQHGVSDTIHLFYGLQIAAQTLYHHKKDEQAILYAKEGLEILRLHEKDNKIIYPTSTFEFCYILSRIYLKQNDVENAGHYLGIIENLKIENLQEEQVGRKYILQGDYLLQKRDYERAKAFYAKAIIFWHEKFKPKCSRLQFFYYMYAISQKAESMLLGGIEGEKGEKDRYVRKMYGESNGYTEYAYVFEKCTKMLYDKIENMADIAEKFMFQAIDRLLEQKVSSQFHDCEQFTYLCQMAAYCTQKGLDFSKQIQVFIDGLCTYDMRKTSVWLSFSNELESTWLDIFPYIQKRMEQGAKIREENYELFAWMWYRVGCYEEALKWTKSNDLIDRIHRDQIGAKENLDVKLENTITLQGTAHRYLHLIKIWTKKENYFSLEESLQEKLWEMSYLVRKSYIHANLFFRESWEKTAKKIKKITGNGMSWQVDFKDADKEIYHAWENLYSSLEESEEKHKIGEAILKYWRSCQDTTKLNWLSDKNLYLLQQVEEASEYPPSPYLVAEIAKRRGDYGQIHDYFSKFERYMTIPDDPLVQTKRQKEAMFVLDELIMENPDEWYSDFETWILVVKDLRCIADMKWLKYPQKGALYDIYCQFMKFSKEEIMNEIGRKIIAPVKMK